MFTYNNPSVEPVAFSVAIQSLRHFRYCIYQQERGESGTSHFQGYVEFSSPVRASVISRLYRGIHVEKRRGTRDQARDYCRKEDTREDGPFELGIWEGGGQGKRTDLGDACQLLLQTRDVAQVASTYPVPYVKYFRGLSALLSVTSGERTIPPRVTLYYGPTGTGKTRRAYTLYPGLYRKAPDTRWFDGYTGQEVLLLDDFMGAASKMSLAYLLQLLDRYPISVEIKGNYVPLVATRIIVTTNLHPWTWYDYTGRTESFSALARRFSDVLYWGPLDGYGDCCHGVDVATFFHNWAETCNEAAVYQHVTPAVSDESSDDEDVVAMDLNS